MSSYSYVTADMANHPEKYNIVDKSHKIFTIEPNSIIDDILHDNIRKHFTNYEINHNEKNVPVKYGDKIEKADVSVRYYFDDFASFKSVAVIEYVCDGTELDLYGLLNDVFERIVNHEILNKEDEADYYQFDYYATSNKHIARSKIVFGSPIIIDQYGIFADEFGRERHFKLTCALPYLLNPRMSIWERFYSEFGSSSDPSHRDLDADTAITFDPPLTETTTSSTDNNNVYYYTSNRSNTAATAAASHTHTTADVDTDVNVHSNASSMFDLSLLRATDNNDDASNAPRFSAGRGYDLDSSPGLSNYGAILTASANTTATSSVRELVLDNATYANPRSPTAIIHDHAIRTTLNGVNSYTEALERYNRELPTFDEIHNEIIGAYERISQQQRPRTECLNRLVDINV